MSYRARFSVALALFALGMLLAACSLFDSDGGATPTPTAGPAIGGKPEETGPTVTAPGTVYNATWVAADTPAALEGTEIESPFADLLPGVGAVWRLYVVDGESVQPRLLQETGRWLGSPLWSPMDDSVSLSYLTRIEGSDSFVRGYEQLDATSGSANWNLFTDIKPSYDLSPDGTRFVVKEGTGRPYSRGPLYVTAPGGETLTLDGFTAEDIREWSPDGRYLVVTGYAGQVTTPQEPSRLYYLIGPGGDEIVLLGRAGLNEGLLAGWSPDSSMVAYVLGEDLMVYKVATHQLRTIRLGVHIEDWPLWSVNGRYVVVKDGVVDADTAALILTPSPEAPPRQDDPVRAASVSEDGSMLAWTESIFTSDCDGLQSTRAWLKDVATGQDTVLFDCGDRVFIGVEWIDAGHLLVRSADCDQCEPRYFEMKLFSFPGGSSRDLTGGPEDSATYAVSPDRSRILVGGEKLRLFDSVGELLRVVEAPAGYKVTGLSWSRDGASFTYIVGPEAAFLP